MPYTFCMATANSIANFQAACGEVYDAIEASNFATAWKWYAKAEAQNAGLDVAFSESGASIARRSTLVGLREAIESAERAAGRLGNTSRLLLTTTAHTGTPQRRRSRRWG